MSNLSLRALTWGTVAAAIASALWLAAGDSGFGEVRQGLDDAAVSHDAATAPGTTRPGAHDSSRAPRVPHQASRER